jgi:hypothetical protein
MRSQPSERPPKHRRLACRFLRTARDGELRNPDLPGLAQGIMVDRVALADPLFGRLVARSISAIVSITHQHLHWGGANCQGRRELDAIVTAGHLVLNSLEFTCCKAIQFTLLLTALLLQLP